MKQARLVIAALFVVAAGTWAVHSTACDWDKTKASAAVASSKSTAACSAEMAAKCTPEMAAACKAAKAKAATAAAAGGCPYHNSATAVTASTEAMDHCSGKTSSSAAYTASASGSDHCAGKTSASAAASGTCTGKGMFQSASSSDRHCSSAKSASMAAGHCGGMGMTTLSGRSAHGDCDACEDMSACNEELEAAGAHVQVVSLKNGVMFVYTADRPGQVNAVQSALARRSEHLSQLVSAGDRAKLCSECKSMRGAMASGKLVREVVNIEGGSLTLVTSTDPSLVNKIHTMVDTRTAVRIKS